MPACIPGGLIKITNIYSDIKHMQIMQKTGAHVFITRNPKIIWEEAVSPINYIVPPIFLKICPSRGRDLDPIQYIIP